MSLEPQHTDPTTDDAADGSDQHDRRALLRRAALVGGATLAATALGSRQASAADGGNVVIGAVNEGTNPTRVFYTGGPTYPAGPSVLSGGEAGSPLAPLFPAGVGGYGVNKVSNGVHGSTAVAAGFGVVAANGAAPADGTTAPKALALASLGSQVQFLTPAQVAAAAGIANYPATIGPSKGTHVAGELYVDDEFNLWFAVPNGSAVRWVKLAGQQTSGSLVTFPAPARILDTRPTGNRIPSGVTVTVSLKTTAGGADSGLPVGARAALVNLTVADTVGKGHHSAYSADVTTPTEHSSVNWDASGQERANLAVVTLGSASASTERAIKLTSGGGGSTHLIIDLLGYYL
ncbi:MAG: hypothetical protein ACOYL9_08250 [Ilumatobacteraceae bacterium]